jgi:hypothetical protein
VPSDGPGIVNAGVCFGCCGNVSTSSCLAMEIFSASATLVLSHHVTIFQMYLYFIKDKVVLNQLSTVP